MIKEKLEQVRSQLPDEVLSKVGSTLKVIESEAMELSDSLKAANSESKDRKIKIRELDSKIQDFDIEKQALEAKISELNTQLKNPERDSELQNLRKYKEDNLNRQRESFINSFGEIEKHPNFEKAKGRFVIPSEKDEGGGIKWDQVKPEEMEKNINTLADLNALDYFGAVRNNSPNPNKGNNFSPPAEYKEKLAAAKTPHERQQIIKEELARHNQQ